VSYKQEQAPANLDTDGLRKFTQDQLLKIARATIDMEETYTDDITGLTTRVTALEAIPRREVLTANRTYYCRTDGSDANTGLIDSAGGAFLTAQKLIDTICSIDMKSFQVTGQFRSGTFVGGLVLGNYVGKNAPILVGDMVTPSNVVLSYGGNDLIYGQGIPPWNIQGVKLVTTGSGRYAVRMYANSYLNLTNIEFGACTSSNILIDGGYIFLSGACTISAAPSSGTFAACTGDAGKFRCQASFTITGTPNFANAFAIAGNGGLVRFDGSTFSGAATGRRYAVDTNAIINTGGGGATFLPGSIAGTTATGGLYI
jgi:hypothetical protein